MGDWIHYSQIDFDHKEYNVFSIDTRDFYAAYNFIENHEGMEKVKKYPDFFHTKEEVTELLDRLYSESGGEGKWRMLSISVNDSWNLKYIRIYRTDLGFLVCDSYSKALRKTYLSQSVNKEYLSKH